MKFLRKIRNYICYCGIEKDEFNAIKKDAYRSNFEIWKILHIMLSLAFGFLFVNSLFSELLKSNRVFYLALFIYFVIASCVFFILKKDSLLAQFLIYLSISALFLFGCLITQNKPETPATMFIVLLLITPMFMIDKPFFMAMEMCVASAVFLVWMYQVKPYTIWKYDFVNILIYLIVGIMIHIVANSLRIKEFVLTRKLNIQKDTDELTNLKNKAALTREINEYLSDKSQTKGLMFLLDINHFKNINDTYGHDIGDDVIRQIGTFLNREFNNGEIAGRFGGDEFILFVKYTDDLKKAAEIAEKIWDGTNKEIKLPDDKLSVSVSIGISVYHGIANNYSEMFKKADVALYQTKTDRSQKYCFYTD